MCTALWSTLFSSLLHCVHRMTKWAFVHMCELVLIIVRNSAVPKSVSVFSLGKILYLRCFFVHSLMEFLGNVCRKEYNIFQYLHVGIPQNFHVAYIGMLYVEISMFFFAVIFPINNTFAWVGFLTYNFNSLWQNGLKKIHYKVSYLYY